MSLLSVPCYFLCYRMNWKFLVLLSKLIEEINGQVNRPHTLREHDLKCLSLGLVRLKVCVTDVCFLIQGCGVIQYQI